LFANQAQKLLHILNFMFGFFHSIWLGTFCSQVEAWLTFWDDIIISSTEEKSRLGYRVTSLKFIKSVFLNMLQKSSYCLLFFSKIKNQISLYRGTTFINLFSSQKCWILKYLRNKGTNFASPSWKPYNPTEIHIWSFQNLNSIIEFRQRGHMCRHSTVELEIPPGTVKDVNYYYL